MRGVAVSRSGLALLALASLALHACRTAVMESANLSDRSGPDLTVTAGPVSPTDAAEPSGGPPTAVLSGALGGGGSGESLAATPTARLAADPLRFTFPTPAPVPVSAWRPPLYPVPWSLTPFDHFYFQRPIAADEVNWPLADYRYGGNFFDEIVHTGVDIPAPMGTPVLAAGSGKVLWAGYGLYSGVENPDDPYGLAVALRHDYGHEGQALFTVYGHLSEIDVLAGQHVEAGELLGQVGDTGFTTGPHLHFEVRIGDNRFFTTRNPELWVAPPQGWGVLAGRVMDSIRRPLARHRLIVENLDSGLIWTVLTYSDDTVNSDPYYRENLVLGDLPAGRYEIRISFAGILYTQEIDILPGLINYFSFAGRNGFDLSLPSTPEPDFTPMVP